MKDRKDSWVQGDINNAKTFGQKGPYFRQLIVSTHAVYGRYYLSNPVSKKDATTGLDRQDTAQKDPVVKIFRMLGLLCYTDLSKMCHPTMLLK
jgi:hypothetical protein